MKGGVGFLGVFLGQHRDVERTRALPDSLSARQNNHVGVPFCYAVIFTSNSTPMRYALALLVFGLLTFTGTASAQQSDAPQPVNPYGSGIGLNISLTNSGFGLGGYYQRAYSPTSSIIAEFSIGAVKDEREQRFFGFFGESFIPNKQNYLLVIPVQAGIQRRLFSETIQDNFRPYVQFTAGPTLGWVSPYYDDQNGNNIREQGERTRDVIGALPRGKARLAMGGTIAFGANFGVSRRVAQGIRFGYTFNYFFDDVALLEPSVKAPQRFFGTPTITLTFGRLY